MKSIHLKKFFSFKINFVFSSLVPFIASMINNLGKPMALKARKFLDISNLPSTVKNCQYAVRGQIPLRAQQITKEIESGKRYPFKKVTFCNVCNFTWLF